MKTYSDNKIEFSYSEEYKLIMAKQKWGQYCLKKGESLITIDLTSEDTIDSVRRVIQSHPPDDIGDLNEIEYFKSVKFGEKQGIGHVAISYDRSHKFWGKIYRYLFPTTKGGLYIEISDRKDFTIDDYMEFLKSIEVK